MRAFLIAIALTLGAVGTSPLHALTDDAALATTPPNEWTPQMLRHYQHTPRYKAWESATKFFVRAQCDHRIPEYSAETGSKFDVDLGALSDLRTVSYPVSFTFRVTRPHDKAVYCYSVSKSSHFSPWQFQDAWKQTREGKRIAPLAVPKT
ncbi:MAG TPA: hypothetical protein VGM62_11015 [Chthoniobacterales bacterium]|jgi:hypothetical protein